MSLPDFVPIAIFGFNHELHEFSRMVLWGHHSGVEAEFLWPASCQANEAWRRPPEVGHYLLGVQQLQCQSDGTHAQRLWHCGLECSGRMENEAVCHRGRQSDLGISLETGVEMLHLVAMAFGCLGVS